MKQWIPQQAIVKRLGSPRALPFSLELRGNLPPLRYDVKSFVRVCRLPYTTHDPRHCFRHSCYVPPAHWDGFPFDWSLGLFPQKHSWLCVRLACLKFSPAGENVTECKCELPLRHPFIYTDNAQIPDTVDARRTRELALHANEKECFLEITPMLF